MKSRVMCDIESLGTRPGSAILSIGAVQFTDDGITSEFYQRIDLKSCTDYGLTIDPDTVLWWFKQADEARLEIVKPGNALDQVLGDFGDWLGSDPAEIWGNGASFDNALLAAAYHAIGRKLPWKYSADRCYRTIKALHPQNPFVRTGTLHNALDDARTQARHLLQILVPQFDHFRDVTK
jgi:DNA polymerase III epsilon subunit-like protein